MKVKARRSLEERLLVRARNLLRLHEVRVKRMHFTVRIDLRGHARVVATSRRCPTATITLDFEVNPKTSEITTTKVVF